MAMQILKDYMAPCERLSGDYFKDLITQKPDTLLFNGQADGCLFSF